MRSLTITFLILCFYIPNLLAQLPEDCVDARVLVDVPTNLFDIPIISIDSLENSGNEPAELNSIPIEECGPHGYSPKIIDKSYWIAFSAVTNGTLEFMISPENDGTDYDFALFEGFCPNDQCSDPIFCNYLPYLCLGTAKTGVADDPLATFGVDASISSEIHNKAIDLKAGFNYYLLIENRNEEGNICPNEDPNAGFTVEFAGSALVDKLIERPTIAPNFPSDTSQTLFACEGDIMKFSVTQVPNAMIYDWSSKSIPDAIVTPNALGDSVSVQFGPSSGQICMEMVCPIQTLICWAVEVDIVPDLEKIIDANTSCEPVDLTTRFRDNKESPTATIAYYATTEDAANETNPLVSNIVNVTGNYWVKKTTPSGCFDIIQVTVVTESIELAPIDSVRVCGTTSYDLTDIPLNSVNGNIGDLVFLFYEDSLAAINRTTVGQLMPPIALLSGKYWVRAEKQNGGGCFDLKPFDLVLTPEVDIAPIDQVQFCNNSCFDLVNLDLQEVNSQPISNFQLAFYSSEADANVGGLDNTINTEVCESGTYWLRAFSSGTCFDVEKVELIALTTPDIGDTILNIECNIGCIDLSTQVIIEKNGLDQADLTYEYFTSFLDAEDSDASPITDLVICQPTEIWVRVASINGCFDIAKITISGMQLATATLSGNADICTGTMTSLAISCTGTSPFNIVYTDGINNFNVTTTSSNNILMEDVFPDTTTTYRLVSLSDGNGCIGKIEGEAIINVKKSPSILNFSQDCNVNATEYTITFELEGGDLNTYQIAGTNGILIDSNFTSNPIPTGDPYNFEITDANACPSTIKSGFFSCECNSKVGEMDTQLIGVCERAPAIGFYLGGENLEKGDVLVYVLHDQPEATLGNVVANEAMPIFTFDENRMEYGVTYYMSAVITKVDLANQPVLSETDNPCLSISKGTPIIFYSIPKVSLSLSTDTTCFGEPVDLIFNIEGVGPYDLNYYDGEKISTLAAIDSGHTIPVLPSFSTNFFVQTISQNGVPSCRIDLLNMDAAELTVLRIPKVENFQTLCNDEGTMLVLAFDITDGDADTYEVNGISGTLTNNRFISDSIPHGIFYQIGVRDKYVCRPTVLQGIGECYCTPDILLAIEIVQPISCRGEKDATLNIEPLNGKAPYTFFWSTGETSTTVSNIAAGLTSVTMTDGNGCKVVDSISLEEPTSITASANEVPISCYQGRDGGILIVDVQGGTGDYTYSFENGAFQSENLLQNLGGGVYSIGVQDENGCTWSGEVTINQPTQLDVRLGDNLILNVGDSISLDPQINQEETTILWESTDPNICLDCPNPVVRPGVSSQYKVTVTNDVGCTASDEISVLLQNNRRVFIPNVFSPNGDGLNDILRPYGGIEVEEIPIFRIYSRWGELIYELKDMPAESGTLGWNGLRTNGQKAPTGVYLYYAEVLFKDKNSEVLTGDVNLIR